MTTTAAMPASTHRLSATLLITGILLAALTEAIASTVPSLGRGDIIGDIYATFDEFAWIDVGYTALKFSGFMTAPWLVTRFDPRSVLVVSTLAMGLACAIAAATTRLDLLIALRIVQGFSGGILLVAGQMIIFLVYRKSFQPILQALFAMGAVVASATVAPIVQGWLLDNQSWAWIFFCIIPVSLLASGLVLVADGPPAPDRGPHRPFDWIGFALITVAVFCLTYVLTQGTRWDWSEEPRIVWLSLIGAATLLAFIGQQLVVKGGLLDLTAFRSEDFLFAFIVSFVAGAALFGSAFLIPSFAVSVLGFRPTDAGLLLLPSGAFFIGSLLVSAYLFQGRGIPPFATVPFGILMIMVAMWMLSGSTNESGTDDMLAAILLRGFGLGFLFLSITLIAFSDLSRENLASGIAIFNTGRQLGGLIGVAGLQTLIDHDIAHNLAVLGANVTAGVPAVSARLATLTTLLASKGMDTLVAGRAATKLLGSIVVGQSTVIAFDTAFNAVALLFVFAAPVLVAIKIGLSKRGKTRSEKSAVLDQGNAAVGT